MSNVAEFIETRLQIESLVQQIVERTALPRSIRDLDRAGQLLESLKAMADNDVQENAVGRLTGALGSLRTKIEKLAHKTTTRKKGAVV